MAKSKFQFSILGFLVLIAFTGIGISVWQQRQQSRELAELQVRLAEIEQDYRIRSRSISLFAALDLNGGEDLEAFKHAIKFVPSLSELSKLGEQSSMYLEALSKESRLIDIDGDTGSLELLLLTTSAKSSPGFDTSIVALFDSDKLIEIVTLETFYRIWHEVIVEDVDRDGILDFRIEKYLPGNSNAKRQVTEEMIYTVGNKGFQIEQVKIAE